MPFLRYHPAEDSGDIDPYRFPGRVAGYDTSPQRSGVGGRLSFNDEVGDPVADVEQAIEKVDSRLKNLRDLVDQFGLDDDGDGPRAA